MNDVNDGEGMTDFYTWASANFAEGDVCQTLEYHGTVTSIKHDRCGSRVSVSQRDDPDAWLANLNCGLLRYGDKITLFIVRQRAQPGS